MAAEAAERGGTTALAGASDSDEEAGVAWTLAVLSALSTPQQWAQQAVKNHERGERRWAADKQPDSDLRELLRRGAWVDSCVYLPEENSMSANGVIARNKSAARQRSSRPQDKAGSRWHRCCWTTVQMPPVSRMKTWATVVGAPTKRLH